MKITKFILIMLFMTCLVGAENEKNAAHIALLDKGITEVEIRYESNINGIDVAVVCKTNGSAFRRCSVEIFSFSDGELKSILATTLNASTLKIEERDGMLNFTSGVSGKILFNIDLKYIVFSNKVLVDDSTNKN